MDITLADTPGKTADNVFVHYIPVYRYFRNENTVRFCSDAAPECGMTGITSEYLGDQNTVVCAACGFQVLHELGYTVDG